MSITISVIKADIGSIGGHIAPLVRLLETVREHVQQAGRKLLIDYAVGHTGDDVAILMTHERGVGDERVHHLAWDAFLAGTAVAKQQGLYGAGQMRRQDFSAPAMLPMGELEYTGVMKKLEELDKRFKIRA